MLKTLHPRRIAGSPRLARLLEETPTLGPEHHWEGELQRGYGLMQVAALKLAAAIAFHGALVEGTGRFVDVSGPHLGCHPEFSLCGSIDATGVTLQLWTQAPEMRHEPFLATGLLAADGCEMSGDWRVACFRPGSCGCGGNGGPFRLRRVD